MSKIQHDNHVKILLYNNIIISSEFCYVPKVVLLVSYWKGIQNNIPAKQKETMTMNNT